MKNKNQILMTLLKGRTFIVLLILLVFFSFSVPNFLTSNTLLTITKHVALYGILGIGMTYVIITGGIDLSVGSVVGLSGMIAGGLINEGLRIGEYSLYFNVPTIVLISIVFGAIIGAINGLIITKFNVAPFITTLGIMYIARGIAMLRNKGATFANITGKEGLNNTGFEIIGRSIAGIPISAVILLVLAIVTGFILKYTKFGWHIYAVGGNQRTADLSGVKSNKIKIYVYIISGMCAAIVGIIASSQLVASQPATGESWEMNAIAAAVLGGTSMSGGIGTIGGTIVGAFVIGVINDGMVMMGISEFWQMIIRGAVIILAVIIDQFQRNLQNKIAMQARSQN